MSRNQVPSLESDDFFSSGVQYEFFESMGCEVVKAIDLYTAMFRLGDGLIQQHGEKKNMKANPIAYFKNDSEDFGHFRIMFEDEFDEILLELQEADFAILNGITYFGRRNLQAHANKMYAMIFDLDGITAETLRSFFNQCSGKVIPSPNYIVLSGHGLHLYYIFQQPLALFPNIKLQLKELKYALTRRIWNMYTSTVKEPQYQGINQGFRVAGGRTKKGSSFDHSVVLRYRREFYSVSELNQFVPKESWIDEQKIYKETKYTLEEVKQKFPKWYARVVEQKDHSIKKWNIAGKVHGCNPFALYDWWLNQLQTGATVGHRYFCVMILAIYAAKCDVPKDRLEQDAADLIPYLDSMGDPVTDPFTAADVSSALECYDDRYATFPLRDIEKLSAIDIPRNKRNGQKQEWHLEDMRTKKANMKRRGQPFKNNKPEGRPSKRSIVLEWRQQYPDGRKAECQRETGLSKPTVYKWWDWVSEQLEIAEDQRVHDQIEVTVGIMDEVHGFRTGNFIALSMISSGRSNDEIRDESGLDDEAIELLRNGIDYEVQRQYEEYLNHKKKVKG